jgi:hypothetical protein
VIPASTAQASELERFNASQEVLTQARPITMPILAEINPNSKLLLALAVGSVASIESHGKNNCVTVPSFILSTAPDEMKLGTRM